ncbi:MAG: helix-turn-helix domain-containing protein [Bacteroidota bacterium]
MAKGHSINLAVKATAALQAIKGDQTVNVIASNLGVHPAQISAWKKQLLEEAASVFEGKRGRKQQTSDEAALYEQIGRLKMELE